MCWLVLTSFLYIFLVVRNIKTLFFVFDYVHLGHGGFIYACARMAY